MLKLAVFGHPVAHSLSPRIHGLFAQQCGIEIDYRAIDCPAGNLGAALHAFRNEDGRGCNLTVPLKAEGLDLAASWTQDAREAAACNTLTLQPGGGWHADNTDGAGLVRDLERLGIDIGNRGLLIIGAGGAAAGILGPLLRLKPRAICVVNRDVERARQLCARFADMALQHRIELAAASLEHGPAGRYDRVIQATSLGHTGTCPALQREWLAPAAIAYDLNYGPAFAPFRSWCESNKVDVHGGFGMLIEQAALAFERFTGSQPEIAPVLEAFAAESSARQ
ncbi:MAG: shikimate dehydrogenase [Wenzhouxiangellaceae bacterium]|nr:shikimate dehydrogenase [Wenzhouxiangellaceae bacterium]